MYRHQRINIDATYRYDANGNNIHGDGRSLTYYTFDKPKSIIKGNHKVEFEYGPDRGRYYRKDTDTSTNRVTQTYYIGNVEKVSNPDGSQAWKRYLGNVIIEHKRNSAGVEVHKKAFYSLKDHLGSLNVLLEKRSSTFVLKDTLEFDPWGQRRAVNWSLMAQSAIAGQYFHNTSISNALGSAAYQSVTSRGFTGHEMLDEVGIIHMNGRIYDPKLGRFLQADASIDGVTSTQGYNRYSYVHNNPLNAIDPSGHFSLRKYVGLIVAVVGGIFCPPCLAFGWQAFALGAFAGAAGAIANGADILAGALLGGVSGLAFAGVNGVEFGTGFGAELAQFASFGAVGGVTAVLAGGKFGHGFIAAGAGGTVGGKIGDIGGSGTLGPAIRTVARAILGGTISKLTGGKFANGAGAAAFASLMREVAQRTGARSNAQKGFGGRFQKITGMSVEDSISLYKSQTGEALTTDQVEKMFTDPAYAKEQLMANKNLHTVYRSILNSNAPQTAAAAATAGYQKLGFWKSIFHNPIVNSKWVGPSGHMEGVYNSKGNIVNSNSVRGTFNFFGPDQAGAHKAADVDPYFKWGN